MDWKLIVKRAIPPAALNRILLTFPQLYRTRWVSYETTLYADHGLADLRSQLALALPLGGDIIECGSSRCGASIIMATELEAQGARKTIYACDSFEGFDRAELAREKNAGLTHISDTAFTSTSYEYVTRKIKALGVEDTVIPIKGFFQDTLPRLDTPFCLALIDCDLRDSLRYCADTIWPRLVGGGRLVFDDYTNADFRGARLGIDAFVTEHRAEITGHGLLHRLYFVSKR